MQIQIDLQPNQTQTAFSNAIEWPDTNEVVILPTIMERPKFLKAIAAPFQWRRKWNSFMNGVISGAISFRFD